MPLRGLKMPPRPPTPPPVPPSAERQEADMLLAEISEDSVLLLAITARRNLRAARVRKLGASLREIAAAYDAGKERGDQMTSPTTINKIVATLNAATATVRNVQ